MPEQYIDNTYIYRWLHGWGDMAVITKDYKTEYSDILARMTADGYLLSAEQETDDCYSVVFDLEEDREARCIGEGKTLGLAIIKAITKKVNDSKERWDYEELMKRKASEKPVVGPHMGFYRSSPFHRYMSNDAGQNWTLQ